jgi:hypothetical protein
MPSRQQIRSWEFKDESGERSLRLARDGSFVVTAGHSGRVHLLEVRSGLAQLLAGPGGVPGGMALARNGRRFVVVSDVSTLTVYDTKLRRATASLDNSLELGVTSVAFSPSGERIVVGTATGRIELWDPETGREVARIKGHATPAHGVGFVDEDTVVSLGQDGLRYWRVAAPQRTKPLDTQVGAPGIPSVAAAVELEWDSQVNQSYQVQCCVLPDTNAWVDLGAAHQGNGGKLHELASTLQPNRAYRVVSSPNLVANADFSRGNIQFTNDYFFFPAGVSEAPSTYAIRTNSQDFNPGYTLFNDHTTGTGRMLLVDGYHFPNKVAWTETVGTSTNTAYTFSAWATASDPVNPAVLAFLVNGVQVGADFVLSTNAGQWQRFMATWDSGTSTQAVISIVDTNIAGPGNDFALDDLSFTANSSAHAEAQPLNGALGPKYQTPVTLPAAELSWKSGEDELYQVQCASTRGPAVWADLGSPVRGNGTTNYFLDSTHGQPQKAYRVLRLR